MEGKPRVSYADFIAQQKAVSFKEGTVAQVLERYWKEMSQGERPLGSSMTYRLRAIQRMPIGKMMAAEIVSHDVIEFCRWRRAQVWHGKQITPTTVGHDVAMLVVAFKYARAAWKECSDLNAAKKFDKAKPFLVKNGLIGKSEPRSRRPTPEELERLVEFFTERNQRANTTVDMALLTIWQVASGRRVSETCRLMWGDWNPAKRIILVRKMKDPRRKKDKLVALTDEATAILQCLEPLRLRPDDPTERIFPFNHRSVIAAYVEAKKRLGINGLRLHDSRRECATRLIQKGYSSKLVGLVTGHEPGSQILERTYISLVAEDFHSAKLQPEARA